LKGGYNGKLLFTNNFNNIEFGYGLGNLKKGLDLCYILDLYQDINHKEQQVYV
jgi:hypothetical protein